MGWVPVQEPWNGLLIVIFFMLIDATYLHKMQKHIINVVSKLVSDNNMKIEKWRRADTILESNNRNYFSFPHFLRNWMYIKINHTS